MTIDEFDILCHTHDLSGVRDLKRLKEQLYAACRFLPNATEDRLKTFQYYVNVFKNQAFSLDKLVSLMPLAENEQAIISEYIGDSLLKANEVLTHPQVYSNNSHKGLGLLFAPKGTVNGLAGTFSGCTWLQLLDDDFFWQRQEWYAQYSFENCTSLIEVNNMFCGNVEYTFRGCSSLRQVNFADGFKSVLYGAFDNANNLEEVSGVPLHPRTVGGFITVGDYYYSWSMGDCPALKKIRYVGTPNSINISHPRHYLFPRYATQKMMGDVYEILADTGHSEPVTGEGDASFGYYRNAINIYKDTYKRIASQKGVSEDTTMREIEEMFMTKNWYVAWI